MKEDQALWGKGITLASHHVLGLTGANEMLFSPLEHAKVGMKNLYH